jgi:predicted ferric reductase/Ca2+-binding EF-hand superfamily protein
MRFNAGSGKTSHEPNGNRQAARGWDMSEDGAGEGARRGEVRTGHDVSARLRDIEARFKAIAGSDDRIDAEELRRGLGLSDPDYAARIFAQVDRDGSGIVSLWEFIEFAKILIDGSDDDKLRVVFDLHDLNGDGTIDPRELTHILDRSLNEHHLDISPDQLNALSRALFDAVDTDRSGAISFAEFKACIEAHPALKAQMVARSATWLSLPQRIPRDRRRPGRRFRAAADSLLRLWQNSRPWLVLLAVYAGANVWLFREGMAAEAMNGSDLYTQVAMGAAMALKLNGALILVSMLRQTLTFLRRTLLGPYLPLDQMVAFHKVVGHVGFALALVHVGGYIAAYESLIDPDFFTRDIVYGELIKSREGWTGAALIVTFLILWAFSWEAVRNKGWFEVFYVTHRLFWLWFAFLLLHDPEFWQWVAIPGALFLIEQAFRLYRGRRATGVTEMTAMPSNVTRIRMTRPDWFDYQPGEYVYLRQPAISKREWHPFTVTSNPEDDSRVELHVRGVGTWTRRLHDLAELPAGERPAGWQTVYLDGPYGSPAADIFDARIPVLIGAGIGVTPFAAILRSILHRRRLGVADGADIEKVYFIWMNRDQQAFEWFVGLMAELEEDPETRDLVDIRIHLTGLRTELTSASLTVALEVYHEATGRDLLTGLKTFTHLERPDWRAVFSDIRAAHPDREVDVFYCGPEGLSRILSGEAGRAGFGYKKENF